MRTCLDYIVDKEEEYNFDTGKCENHIKSRGFNFHVTGSKTEQEHNRVVLDFQNFLHENKIHSDGFMNGTWEEALKYGTEGQKDFYYLSININHVEEKGIIKELYKKWKAL